MRKRQKQTDIIAGLDMGSTAIRIAVGQYASGNDVQDLQILGAVDVPSEGIQKGMITSIEETVSSLSNAIEQAERLVGVPIEHVWVGMSSAHILSQENKGIVSVAKSDGEIAEEDVQRAIEAARAIASPLNYEVVHVLPKQFCVDGQVGIKDPVGMTGMRLEVEAQIIHAATPYIKNVTKAIYRTGIDIDDLVLSILATGDTVVTGRQKQLGVAIVDIGGSTTSITVYEEGKLLHTAVIPIGSNHITNDLALGLQIDIDAAELIKMRYGTVLAKGITRKDTLPPDADILGTEGISLRYVIGIIQARVGEILERVNKELAVVGRHELLPAGVVFTGGGAKIGGLVEYAKEVMKMNASLGASVDMTSATDKVYDIAFANAIGLVRWGAHVGYARKSTPSTLRIHGGKFAHQIQKVFRFLIP